MLTKNEISIEMTNRFEIKNHFNLSDKGYHHKLTNRPQARFKCKYNMIRHKISKQFTQIGNGSFMNKNNYM